MIELLKPPFIVAVLMLLGAAALCWAGHIGEAGYLTVTLAVGAGYGLGSTTVQSALKALRSPP